MTRSPVPAFARPFLKLSFVNVASNLTVPIAGLLDLAFLGHLQEIYYLAGVAIATVVFNYLYWTFGFLRMSTTGLIAQAQGRSDWSSVYLVGLRHGAMALFLGFTIILLQVPLREMGFWILRADPQVLAAAQSYFNAMIWGAPATLLNYVITGWLLGRSLGVQGLILASVINLTKVLLDYLFIVQWGWGSTGAGAAGALSAIVGSIVGITIVCTIDFEFLKSFLKRELGQSTLFKQLWNPIALRTLFNLNSAILIRTFALLTTIALFTQFSAQFGTAILTANALIMEALGIGAYFIDGFAFATETYAGQFYAQQDKRSLQQLRIFSGTISFGFGLGFALLFLIFPDALFKLLTHHSEIRTLAAQSIGWLTPIFGFGAIAWMLDGYFLGLSQGKVLRDSSLVATGIGFLPIALLSVHVHSLPLLWFAMTSFMATRAITLLWRSQQELGLNLNI